MVDTLSHCGLLKYFQIPLMCSTKCLLDKMVRFWDLDAEFFIIQEERIEITLIDIYFLIMLPMLGVIDDTMPKLTHGVSLDNLCERHCYASAMVHSSYILVCYIESLANREVVVMVLWILGSS